MNVLNPCHLLVPAIPEEVSRPLWSVMIPTYNCANYLRETLASVLAQDPGPDLMQIEVIDDHSTKDDPKSVVEELGRGRVGFYQQPENIGYIRNFETCLLRSRGHLVHLLHGDDYVRDGFYQKIQQAFASAPEIGYAFCRHIYMDEQGHWQSISPLEQSGSGIIKKWLEKIAAGQRLATPSVVVRREVYEQLGGFDRRFTCAGEDWEMWVRIATRYPVWFETEPLAAYRVQRKGSLTSNAKRAGVASDMRLATEIVELYLHEYIATSLAKKTTKMARQMYASWAVEAMEGIPLLKEPRFFYWQVIEVFRCSCSWKTLQLVILVIWKRVNFLWSSTFEKLFIRIQRDLAK